MTNAKRPEKIKCEQCDIPYADCGCFTYNRSIDDCRSYYESDPYIQSLIDTGRVAVDYKGLHLAMINTMEYLLEIEESMKEDKKRDFSADQSHIYERWCKALAASPSVIKVVRP